MVTLTQLPPVFESRCYDEVPQHPLERLCNLRIDINLRRNTFANWPVRTNVSADGLWDNGFYYTGISDKVQCTFCGGILSGWSKDDDISHEHARHFGLCEIVQLQKRLMCIPREDNMKEQKQSMKCDVKYHNMHYSQYEDRVMSFRLLKTSMKQSAESLAAAGLYYKGTDDKCQCYVCGGILYGWEENDIPQEEHKKCFPKCSLLKIHKK